MKIERLSIDSFGHFHGAEIGPFTGGIVVVHGTNEAGKTTLLAFIQAVFFGFPRKTDPLSIPALNGGAPGGRVVLVDDAGERFTIGRTEGVRGGPVTVFDQAGTDHGEDRLQALLGGVSRDTFQNVFSFGIDQLSTIRSLQGADISSQMYGAGMGAEGLPDALAGIEKRAGDIFRPGGRTQPVFYLLTELEEVDQKLRDLPDDAARYGQLQDDLARLTVESQTLQATRRSLQEERAKIDAVLDAEHALEQARSRLIHERSNVPAVDDNWLAERAASIHAAEQANAELAVLLRQFQEEERRLAAIAASGSPAVPVMLLSGAAVAIVAGTVAGGGGLIVGLGVALALIAAAAVSFMSRQRRVVDRRAQANRVRCAHSAYLSQRERLVNQLAALGVDASHDLTAALATARAELASADSSRRTHRQHLTWLAQQVEDREAELAEARTELGGVDGNLNDRVESIESDLERLDGQIAELHQNIGRVNEEIRRLEEGSGVAAGLAARQQHLLEALRAAADAWSGQMLAREILLRSRQRFEDEHQPAVVQIARRYFETITAGTYDRITVSSDRKEIQVFQPNGVAKLDRELSRGTREQLYLALRFGYITEFGRKSARLPVIVDDILVNFDPARARATAEAFAELSQTNQIIVFTCHPATVDYFRAVSPDVQVVELGREAAVAAD